MKKAAAWALCVLWMMVIFMMSEMSGDVSGAQSGFVTELVERALAFVLGAQTAARIPTDTLELVIRKGAHMGEYAILFWLWARALGLSGAKRPAVTALAGERAAERLLDALGLVLPVALMGFGVVLFARGMGLALGVFGAWLALLQPGMTCQGGKHDVKYSYYHM